MRGVLKSALEKADAVALCADIWTSPDNRGFLGVTAHFVDEYFQLRSFVLGCPRFEGSHSIERIDEFDIYRKVFYVGVDNGANMIKAFHQMPAEENGG